MRKSFAVTALLCALHGAPATAADPTAGVDASRPRASGTTIEPKAFGGVQAPNVRLAALVKAGGTPVRTKGVAAIARTDTGVYCIKPTSGSGIDPAKIIPSLTVDYYYSTIDEVLVQFAAAGSGCGVDRIGVYTLADPDLDGAYSFSNEVGFTIVVP